MSHAVFCSVLMGIDKVFLLVVVDVISIHAPLAGCDATVEACDSATVISIHAPLAGCDYALSDILTPHLRHFNPRTPCGVRLPR